MCPILDDTEETDEEIGDGQISEEEVGGRAGSPLGDEDHQDDDVP